PGLLATIGVAFAVHVRGRARAAIVAASLLGMLVPAALEAAGLLEPSLAFVGGSVMVRPQMTDFPPAATIAVLLVVAVATIVAPSMLVGRTSDGFSALKRRHFAREWHLRSLVPQPRPGG